MLVFSKYLFNIRLIFILSLVTLSTLFSSYCANPHCTCRSFDHKVQSKHAHAEKKNKSFFEGCVLTLLNEPSNGFRASSLMKKRLDSRQYPNLNPTVLSPEQLQYDPVLLIHGDHSNSGLFIPMIQRLTMECPYRPIFTVDLQSSDGIVSSHHLPELIEKVKEITALYEHGEYPRIAFVGHSSGGDVTGPLIKALAEERIFATGIVIKIGSIFQEEEAAEIYHYPRGKVIEIVGTRDVFEGDNSFLEDHFRVNCGHLGLLFHPQVLDKVCDEINNQ